MNVTSDIRVERLLPGCMALFMSALVTATATLVHAPRWQGFAAAFFAAWSLSLPVAVVAAYLTRPLARRLAWGLVRVRDRLPRWGR